MKRRLFIAINLPPEIKEKIAAEIAKLQPLFGGNVRFLKPESWHLTITFLGYQEEQNLGLIIKAIKNAADNFIAPQIEFEKIIYGPPKVSPRMIWLLGNKEISQKLSELKNYLEDQLDNLGVRFQREHRQFNCHLTLARFLRARTNADKMRTDTDSSSEFALGPLKSALAFYAKSLDLMESTLKRSGAEYDTLFAAEFSS